MNLLGHSQEKLAGDILIH